MLLSIIQEQRIFTFLREVHGRKRIKLAKCPNIDEMTRRQRQPGKRIAGRESKNGEPVNSQSANSGQS